MNKCNYVLITVDGVTRAALVTVDGVKRPAREPRWDADDRKWFASHPRRRLRLRPPVPREPCLEKFHDAAERIEAARRCGLIVVILVSWQGPDGFDREPGTFTADIPLDTLTDAGIARLIEGAAAAYFMRDGELR